MALNNALLTAQIAHARTRPKRNAFRYGAYYLCFSLKDLSALGKLTLLSLNRFNLFSFHERDHGGLEQNGESWIRHILAEFQLQIADGDIVLLTMPRLLGHVFNPVSFWFCFDKENRLRAVVSEVNNTFGERHSYLCAHADHRPINADDKLSAKKLFHVSPFIPVSGHYEFRFAYGEEKIGVWINLHDEKGLLLTTSLTGKRQPLTSINLLKHFLRYPLVTFKVIFLIHYQALRLLIKGVRYIPKPAPPTSEVSQ